jgi:hypothetical protein
MEPKGLLPCSQKSAISLYPEPDESSPYHPKCNNKEIWGAAQKQILVFSLSHLYTVSLQQLTCFGVMPITEP